NREAELQENLTELQTIEVTTKSQTVKLRELEREALSSKQLFEALLQRYKITAETQDLQLPDARIVETADIPLLPSSPNRKKLVALSAIGAFGIGIMLVLALEFATTGIGRPEDVETVLDVPYLSSLPLLEPSTNRNALHKIRMTIAEPDHDFVEAIRQARRDLDVRARNASGRVQLICSALPGEGSSIVASNLAHHYALTGQRVLLIDGDIRRAHLTRQLGPNHNVGLINVLQDGAPPEAAILQDTQTNLCFMPAITSSPSPHFNPELLAAPSFTGAIHKLRGYFDVIIMDTPPILPVIDTQFMADQADQLVLVLTWRKTPKALAKKAIKALGENRAKIAGVMVNRVDPDIIEDDRGIPHKLEYSA
ncbi:MAG: polysaccharide biosynthesis tyrosine autokinase, partial [Pseudomonadota bacterium]